MTPSSAPRYVALALLPLLLAGCGGSATPRAGSSPHGPVVRGTPDPLPSIVVTSSGQAAAGQLIGYDWLGPTGRQRREPAVTADPSVTVLHVGPNDDALTLDVLTSGWPTAVELRWFADVPSDTNPPMETETCRPSTPESGCTVTTGENTVRISLRRQDVSRRSRWLIVWASWPVLPLAPSASPLSGDSAGENFAVWAVPVSDA